ncbi:MAG TPA: hypothetical protein VMV90_06325 [Rectinemataceae bacterium]|nr:hypothetical protein [Rectinemataceae bacterium]
MPSNGQIGILAYEPLVNITNPTVMIMNKSMQVADAVPIPFLGSQESLWGRGNTVENRPPTWAPPTFVSNENEIERLMGPGIMQRLKEAIEQNKKSLEISSSDFAELLSNRVAILSD